MRTIWNDNVSHGDTICSFPATLALARNWQTEGVQVGIYWTNQAVAELFPHAKYGIHKLSKPSTVPAKTLSMHHRVHQGWAGLERPKHLHPTAQGMAEAGFPELSDRIHRPELAVTYYAAKPYDVIISPYILAEIQRFWALKNWQTVIDSLRARHPGITIGVLSSTKLPAHEDLKKIDPRDQGHFYRQADAMTRTLTGVQYVTDRPLAEVASLLKQAKIVATVDTGPARLAHAVGCNHVLLCNHHVPYDWATYPEAKTWYGDLSTLEPSEALAMIEAAWPKEVAA